MSLLSDADISAMRATLLESLPDSAVIMRSGTASDGQGGIRSSWTAAGTADCRIGPGRAGLEPEVAGRVSTRAYVQATFPAGTDLRRADRVVYSSDTYEVLDIDAPRSYELSVRAALVIVG